MNEKEFNSMLEKYADVLVKVGLNLRNDQRLSIRSNLESAPLIRKVVKSAYKAGARFVDVLWSDDQVARTRMEFAEDETLEFVPEWLAVRYHDYYGTGQAELAISAVNPDLYSGLDPERIARNRKALSQKISQPLRKYGNLTNWCVAAASTPEWAQKVFPNIPVAEAQEKLWEAIFKACRIDTPDPVKAWEDHIKGLTKYKDYLTAKQYEALHYTAPGTDLTLGLPKGHLWLGAEESFKNGVTATVNIPTEEVFTMPHKDKVNGVVKATLPLNNNGVLIDEFSVTFENGRAVKVTAQKGEADLRRLIETDETACQLGEVALVPNSSPISQSGILFYNTLFDENASCHLALGSAYKNTLENGEEMSDEELMEHGGNVSLIHVDFMIGSADMNIDGIKTDGTREPIIRNGEWAFDV